MNESIKSITLKEKIIDSISISRSLILGIAILLIMLFHASIPVPDNKFLKFLWNIFCNYGGGIGVTLFFIYSGFGLYVSSFKKDEPLTWKKVCKFYKKRAIRILPVYFFVGIIFYAITCKSVSSFFLNLFLISFFTSGERDFWFIAAILVLYIFYPLMWYLISKFKNKLIPIIILFLFSILLEFIFYHSSIIIYNRIEIFIARIPSFMIGLFLGYCYLVKDFKTLSIFTVISLFISLLFLILIIAKKMPVDNRVTRYLFTFVSFLLIIIFSFINIYLPKVIQIPFEFLGKRTLEIYIVHVSFGLSWFKSITSNTALNIILYFILSILVSEVLYETFNVKSNLHKIINKIYLNKYKTNNY